MASLSNSRWRNRKARLNRSTNDGDMAEKAKRPVSESVTDIYIIREKLSFRKHSKEKNVIKNVKTKWLFSFQDQVILFWSREFTHTEDIHSLEASIIIFIPHTATHLSHHQLANKHNYLSLYAMIHQAANLFQVLCLHFKLFMKTRFSVWTMTKDLNCAIVNLKCILVDIF